MKTTGICTAIVLVASLALPAAALDTEELLALIAMPLIVDEVADMTGVPEDRLVAALSAFSGADLRPTRYVEVVQYAPVALAYDARSGETDFVGYVRDVRNDGLVGDPFYDAVTTHYVDTYGIPRQAIHTEPVFRRDQRMYDDRLISPVVHTVVRDIDTAPSVNRAVITDANWSTPRATGMELDDLLALLAMPLIANEVADIADVPEDRVMAALAAFAGADLAPTRYIETVQYVPVALVYDQRTGDTDFVRYVRDIRAEGLVGDRFYDAVTTRYVDTYGIPRDVIGFEPLFLRDEPTIVYQERLISPVVHDVVRDIRSAPSVSRTVVANADWSSHPHGGPPGQLKKRLGLQTGAEVVHGSDRRDTRTVVRPGDRVIVESNDRGRQGKPSAKAAKPDDRGRGQDKARAAKPDNRGQQKANAAKPDNPGQQKAKPKKPDNPGQQKAKAAKPDNRGQQKASGGQGNSGNKGKGNKKKDDGGNRS